MKFWVFLLYYCPFVYGQRQIQYNDRRSSLIMLNLTADVIRDSDQKMGAMEMIKQDSVHTAPFEVGYLMHILQEKYRKMVDKYRTSADRPYKFYVIELILYLEEIERHYWQIEHVSNMMHEIERKYKITSGLHEKFDEPHDVAPTVVGILKPERERKEKKFKMDKYMQQKLKFGYTTKKKHKWWPIDYGWEISYYW